MGEGGPAAWPAQHPPSAPERPGLLLSAQGFMVGVGVEEKLGYPKLSPWKIKYKFFNLPRFLEFLDPGPWGDNSPL